MRATQERLQDVQLRVLEAIDAAITKIGPEKLKEMIDGVLNLATEIVTRLLPIMVNLIETLEPVLQPLLDALLSLVDLLGEAVEWLKTNDVGGKAKSGFDKVTKAGIIGLVRSLWSDDEDEGATFNGHARADGGVASIPTIVGERGAEMVIPFDFARRGRANNLVQTFNQTFNLAQNQTTASSLAATMRTNGRWGR